MEFSSNVVKISLCPKNNFSFGAIVIHTMIIVFSILEHFIINAPNYNYYYY